MAVPYGWFSGEPEPAPTPAPTAPLSGLQLALERRYPGITESLANVEFKQAAMPRKLPVLPGEFSKDMLNTGARVAIPWELGTRAYAGAEKALEGLKALGSQPEIDLAADAFRRYVSRFAR